MVGTKQVGLEMVHMTRIDVAVATQSLPFVLSLVVVMVDVVDWWLFDLPFAIGRHNSACYP